MFLIQIVIYLSLLLLLGCIFFYYQIVVDYNQEIYSFEIIFFMILWQFKGDILLIKQVLVYVFFYLMI